MGGGYFDGMPLSTGKEGSELSAEEVIRLRESKQLAERRSNEVKQAAEIAAREMAMRAAYKQALATAMVDINAAAKAAIERLKAKGYPDGELREIAISYTPSRRLLGHCDDARLRFGRYHRLTEKKYATWRLNAWRNDVFLASTGKVYVQSASRWEDLHGDYWTGLHEIDSADIGDSAGLWPYAHSTHTPSKIADVSRMLIVALDRL